MTLFKRSQRRLNKVMKAYVLTKNLLLILVFVPVVVEGFTTEGTLKQYNKRQLHIQLFEKYNNPQQRLPRLYEGDKSKEGNDQDFPPQSLLEKSNEDRAQRLQRMLQMFYFRSTNSDDDDTKMPVGSTFIIQGQSLPSC